MELRRKLTRICSFALDTLFARGRADDVDSRAITITTARAAMRAEIPIILIRVLGLSTFFQKWDDTMKRHGGGEGTARENVKREEHTRYVR